MDGDRAPLDDLAAVCACNDAWLMVDDAHGFGVLRGGRGSAFEFDPAPDIPLQMGTLSKAAGVYGAFLCASVPVIELMKNRARSVVYTTGLPPSVVAAAIAAVDIIAADTKRVAHPIALAKMFCKVVGLDKPESPIVPMIFGGEAAPPRPAAALEDAGDGCPIRPPTVPAGTSRLRFTFTAEHTSAQVAALREGAVNALDLGRGSVLQIADG